MVDLYAVLNKGNNYLVELKAEIPKKNSWKQGVFLMGTIIGVIIAVAGLIFAYLSVLITGILLVGGCLLASFGTDYGMKKNMNEVSTLALEKFDIPKTPKTPKSIPLNPFEKLAEKEQKINELEIEVARLKRQYGIK